MHTYLILAVLAFAPASALALGTIQATTVPTSTAPVRAAATPSGSVATPTQSPQEASVDYFLKIDGVNGESKDPTPTPKPQENQNTGIEPDDIDYSGDDEPQPLTPDFSILLGGGGSEGGPKDDGVVVLGAEVQEEVGEILKEGMAEADRPVEDIAFNYEKVSVKVREEVKLFGIIPVGATAGVDIGADGSVNVKYPWWTFLASGKDDTLGEQIVTSLSSVLKTKHDTVKNAISNVR